MGGYRRNAWVVIAEIRRLEHKAYKDSDYTQYIVSIDDIESKTGFDLFAGLPEYLEAAVEAAKPSWSEFSNF